MRIGWLGLVAVAVLAASCGEDSPLPPDPPKFRVGGTITGLAGSLTLQLNGAENLTRGDNGAFTFQTELADQSPFTVAVTASPADQDCSLQGATGQVSGADVGSIQVTCAQRTYSLGGTVTGLTGTLQLRLEEGETLSVTANGPYTFQTRLPKGGTYSVSIATQPRGHQCTLTLGSGTVTGNVTGITAQCTPWFSFAAFPAATVVLGQSDFTSSARNQGEFTPSATTLDGPGGNPVFQGGKLYIPDLGSNRILGFDGLPSQNGASASFVLGQPDLTSATATTERGGFSGPDGLFSDGTRMAAADQSNHRILLYNALPTGTTSLPDLIVGQEGFDTAISQCSASGLNAPRAVSFTQGKLVVADTFNHRVLIWSTLPTTNGAPANLVLGQTSFTSCAGNDANGDGTVDSAPTASTLFFPAGVWTDGTRLLVSDSSNNRVLLWNQFPTSNGQPADVVLGQSDFTSRTAAISQARLSSPSGVTSTGQQLFVADIENSRVLVWNELPTANGQAANLVLGQPDFTSRNRGDPTPGTRPSARSLYQPSGVLLTAPFLVVTDSGNNRVLVFESQ
ncbi:hypothetical protein [Hyalangium sp.]|uniref:hypothetical protein n=1 Tax=Hyalangium sp. TaxID=2028555 RepID=UPI002D37052B|nr:hypothetical protein [Hyalangium sp.]HYH95297.1 hypothetical protein [Hyalangium sp.]